jgi:hypothetical protein
MHSLDKRIRAHGNPRRVIYDFPSPIRPNAHGAVQDSERCAFHKISTAWFIVGDNFQLIYPIEFATSTHITSGHSVVVKAKVATGHLGLMSWAETYLDATHHSTIISSRMPAPPSRRPAGTSW